MNKVHIELPAGYKLPARLYPVHKVVSLLRNAEDQSICPAIIADETGTRAPEPNDLESHLVSLGYSKSPDGVFELEKAGSGRVSSRNSLD